MQRRSTSSPTDVTQVASFGLFFLPVLTSIILFEKISKDMYKYVSSHVRAIRGRLKAILAALCYIATQILSIRCEMNSLINHDVQ